MFNPTYTPSPTIPFAKPLIQSADVNTQTTTLNTYLGGIDDQRALAVQTANITLTANRDVYVPVNSTGGAFTVTLPDATTHTTQPIIIKKVSNDLTEITIQRAGSDTIENPYAVATTPVATSITLVLPGEYVALYPTGTTWRVVNYGGNPNVVYARAFRNATQSIANSGFNKIQFNAETSDVYNLFDSTTNFRFTCPVTGIYEISASVAVAPGTSSDCVASIYKNGSEIARGSRTTSASAINSIVFSLYEKVTSTSDYFEIFLFNSGAVRNAEAGAGSTYGIFNLKSR